MGRYVGRRGRGGIWCTLCCFVQGSRWLRRFSILAARRKDGWQHLDVVTQPLPGCCGLGRVGGLGLRPPASASGLLGTGIVRCHVYPDLREKEKGAELSRFPKPLQYSNQHTHKTSLVDSDSRPLGRASESGACPNRQRTLRRLALAPGQPRRHAQQATEPGREPPPRRP